MKYKNRDTMTSKIQPEEMNRNNINQIVSYENHLHSVIYRLLHTQVGGIGDERILYFEDQVTEIGNEDGSGMFIVE